MTRHYYRIFGLTCSFDRPIRTLGGSAIPSPARVDVEMVHGDVTLPASMIDTDVARIGVDGADLYLDIEEVGLFRASGGQSIVAQPKPQATTDEVDLFLMGSVFGGILHQRRLLPIHCNAVELEGSAFLFCGDSGAGKSTLAAWFEGRGRSLLTDDLCAVRFNDAGEAVGLPGIPRLRLWQDALDMLGRSSSGHGKIPWTEDKFELHMGGSRATAPLPIAAIYHLRTAGDDLPAGIHRLSGLGAANAITANIYRRRIADLIGRAPGYLADAIRLIQTVPVFSINREWGLEHFAQEAELLEEHALGMVGRLAPTSKCDH